VEKGFRGSIRHYGGKKRKGRGRVGEHIPTKKALSKMTKRNDTRWARGSGDWEIGRRKKKLLAHCGL